MDAYNRGEGGLCSRGAPQFFRCPVSNFFIILCFQHGIPGACLCNAGIHTAVSTFFSPDVAYYWYKHDMTGRRFFFKKKMTGKMHFSYMMKSGIQVRHFEFPVIDIFSCKVNFTLVILLNISYLLDEKIKFGNRQHRFNEQHSCNTHSGHNLSQCTFKKQQTTLDCFIMYV